MTSPLYDIALRLVNTKRGLAQDRKALRHCNAEDEYILDENIACAEESIQYLSGEFERLAQDAPAADAGYLRHAINNSHIESLIHQMSSLG